MQLIKQGKTSPSIQNTN